MIRSILVLAITLAFAAPARAGQQPVWSVPADRITVVNTGTINGLTFATVRDNTMHGHNVYEVAVGARIGKLTVASITADGVRLSNGRELPIETARLASATTQP
jgi:hypothetical protein